MRHTILLLALTIVAGNSVPLFQGVEDQSNRNINKKTKTYDGDWWTASSSDERSGFVDGVADCQTWLVHAEGFSATPDELDGMITRYYKTHPEERKTPVIDVWKRVTPELTSATVAHRGETWKNPHWYLNGLWWRQSSRPVRSAFLEGYLWCVDAFLSSPKDTFARSRDYYVNAIDEYVKAHPQADDEAVATILRKFRNRPTSH